MLIEFEYTISRGLKEHYVRVTAKISYYDDREYAGIESVKLHGYEVHDLVSDIEIGGMISKAWDHWAKNKHLYF